MKIIKNLFLITLLFALAFYLGKKNQSFPAPLVLERGIVSKSPSNVDLSLSQGIAEESAKETVVPDEIPQVEPGFMQIKTAVFSILVKDVKESLQEITGVASSLQGFVISSNAYEPKDGHLQGRISFKVPQSKFDQALSKVRNHALTINNESISGQDVSEEYIDLSARLRNKEATEQELLKLLQKSGSVSDILSVQRELSQVRENIEILKGRINYLEKNIAMSTVTVDLATEGQYLPISEDEWKPISVARSALKVLLEVIKTALNILIWVLIFLSPLILFLILLPLLVIKALHKRKQKKS